MTDKPTDYPDWATLGSKLDPGLAVRNTGHQIGVPPRAQWENYDRDLIARWLRYLEERFIGQYASLDFGIQETSVGEAFIVTEDIPGQWFLFAEPWGTVELVAEWSTCVHCDGRYAVMGISTGKVRCYDRGGGGGPGFLWTSAAIAAAPVGAVCSDGEYVYAASSNVIQRFEIVTGQWLETYTMPGAGTPVVHALMSNGDNLYIGSDYDSVLGGTTHRIARDNFAGGVLATGGGGVGQACNDIVTDGRLVWTANTPDAANAVVRSMNYTTLVTIYTFVNPAGANPAYCLAMDDHRLYVGFDVSGVTLTSIWCLSLNHGVFDHWPAPTWSYNNDVDCLDITTDGRYVYAIFDNPAVGKIIVLDPSTGAVVGDVPMLSYPAVYGVYADGTVLWASHDTDGVTTDALSRVQVKPPPMMFLRHDSDSQMRRWSQLATRLG
jgi:hypothetical protein